MKELPISKVNFVEDRNLGIHKYYLGFSELYGVTTLLSEMLFTDKYDGISRDVLMNAAKRGTAIHEAVQAYEMGVDFDITEDLESYYDEAVKAAQAWAAYRKGAGKKYSPYITAYSEYLVSNEQDLATKIDLTLFNEGWALGDIKTTIKLDMDYLSWQLSLEAYLFERQTGQKVKILFAMWYDRKNNKWVWKEVKRISDEKIEELIQAWRNKREGLTEVEQMPIEKGAEVPAPIMDLGKMIADHEREMKRLKAESDDFKARLVKMMVDSGVYSVKLNGCTLTLVSPSPKKTLNEEKCLAVMPQIAKEDVYTRKLDEEKCLAAHPELANMDIFDISKSSDYVKITLKK